MKPKELIEKILKSRKMTKRALAGSLGISTQALDERLKSDMQLSSFCKTVSSMNYAVVLIPKEGGEGIILDGGDPDERLGDWIEKEDQKD